MLKKTVLLMAFCLAAGNAAADEARIGAAILRSYGHFIKEYSLSASGEAGLVEYDGSWNFRSDNDAEALNRLKLLGIWRFYDGLFIRGGYETEKVQGPEYRYQAGAGHRYFFAEEEDFSISLSEALIWTRTGFRNKPANAASAVTDRLNYSIRPKVRWRGGEWAVTAWSDWQPATDFSGYRIESVIELSYGLFSLRAEDVYDVNSFTSVTAGIAVAY